MIKMVRRVSRDHIIIYNIRLVHNIRKLAGIHVLPSGKPVSGIQHTYVTYSCVHNLETRFTCLAVFLFIN